MLKYGYNSRFASGPFVERQRTSGSSYPHGTRTVPARYSANAEPQIKCSDYKPPLSCAVSLAFLLVGQFTIAYNLKLAAWIIGRRIQATELFAIGSRLSWIIATAKAEHLDDEDGWLLGSVGLRR